ncbi:MAG TPA: SURF1 family protein, partial [Albitalea sp.]
MTVRGVIASIVVFVVAAICVRLGFWQLDRLDQRRERNAVLEARMEADPVTLTGAIADTSGLRFRSVTAEGTWDGARSIVLPGR